MNEGIYDNISNKEYHAANDSYSSSLIKMMGVPAEARYSLDSQQKPKGCYLLGNAIHKVILERSKFDEEFLVAPTMHRGHKKAAWVKWFTEHGANGKEVTAGPAGIDGCNWSAEFEAQTGKNIISRDIFEMIEDMAESLQSVPAALDLLVDGITERSVCWIDKETGLKLRVRPDYWNSRLSDLKSIASVTDKSIWNQTRALQYPLSAEMYRDGVYQATGEYLDFKFIFICKSPPYLCRVLRLPEELSQEGHIAYRRNTNKLAQCIYSGLWPGYSEREQEMVNPYEKPDELDWTGVE